MTAQRAQIIADTAGQRLERLCQMAIDGRRAARTLAGWSERCALVESELQILSHLSRSAPSGVDQTTLAAGLAFSAPQVSACVEKLRTRGLIVHQESQGDRRRHLWQLSAEGVGILQQVVATMGESREAAA